MVKDVLVKILRGSTECDRKNTVTQRILPGTVLFSRVSGNEWGRNSGRHNHWESMVGIQHVVGGARNNNSQNKTFLSEMPVATIVDKQC